MGFVYSVLHMVAVLRRGRTATVHHFFHSISRWYLPLVLVTACSIAPIASLAPLLGFGVEVVRGFFCSFS
jgi:hypothetical protein